MRIGLGAECWASRILCIYSPLFTVTKLWVLIFSLINSLQSFQFLVKVEQSNHVWCCRQQKLSSFLPGLSNNTTSYMPQFLFLFEIIFTICRPFNGWLTHWPKHLGPLKIKSLYFILNKLENHRCPAQSSACPQCWSSDIHKGSLWLVISIFAWLQILYKFILSWSLHNHKKPCLVIHNLYPFKLWSKSSFHRFLSVYTALDIQWKTLLQNIIIGGDRERN